MLKGHSISLCLRCNHKLDDVKACLTSIDKQRRNEENMNKLNNLKLKVEMFITFFILCMTKMEMIVFADTKATGATTEDILGPVNNLNSLLTALVVAIGTIVLIWGVVSVAGALMNSHDGTQILNGVFKIAAGVLMIAIPLVISFLQS